MATGLEAMGASSHEPTHGLRVRDLVTGEWFPHVVRFYLRYRAGRAHAGNGERPELGRTEQAIIFRASAASAAGGAATATLTTASAWITAQGPAGALAAIPAGVVAVVVEMLGRALLDLGLVCDLADRAGVPFGQDAGDVSRLVALAHGTRDEREAGSLGRSLVERLAGGDDAERGRSAGNRRLGEGIAKNLVPVLNIATSAITSWYRTRQLGEAAWRYVRFRRAAAMLESAAYDPEIRPLLIEAAWVLFTADGPLQPAETSSLVDALRDVPPERRADVTSRFRDDESEFLHRLGTVPARGRATIWAALERLAAADGSISAADRRILGAAAKVLGERVSDQHLGGLMDEMRRPAKASSRPSGARARAGNGHAARPRRGAADHHPAPAP